MYLTQKHFCGFFNFKRHTPDFYWKMRLPKRDLMNLKKNYKFETILIDKFYKKEYIRALANFQKIFENNKYEIYRV